MKSSKHSITQVFIDYPSRYYRRYLPQGKPFQIKIDTGNLLLWSSQRINFTWSSELLNEHCLPPVRAMLQTDDPASLPQKGDTLSIDIWLLQPVAKMLRHSLRKNDLSCLKSLLVTGLWDIILTSLLPPTQSCSSKFWVWSCIASNFDKGWRGDHKHKIIDRPFMLKYGTLSQVLLQLVVALGSTSFPEVLWGRELRRPWVVVCSRLAPYSFLSSPMLFILSDLGVTW